MNKDQKTTLQNPFHPLDLSPGDFLVIFKRFEQSRIINKNPKPQLPIQTIAQIISSLKGCRPSQIQKIMTQAMVKQTISYTDFLLFVDHESQIRAEILSWLLHQKSSLKYQYRLTYPIKSKVLQYYESINFLKVINFAGKKLILMIFDRKKILLTQVQDQKISVIDQFVQFNSKESENIYNGNCMIKQDNSKMLEKSMKYSSHKNRKIASQTFKSGKKQDLDFSTPKLQYDWNRIDQESQQYFKKQRENINEMPIQYSAKAARFGAKRISQRTLTAANVSQLKEAFSDIPNQKVNKTQKVVHFNAINPLKQASKKLRSLSKQKNYLSYNPYTGRRTVNFKRQNLDDQQIDTSHLKKDKNKQKKVFQRKGKQYLQESMFQYYCQQLRCLAIAFYNMQVVLIKINQQFNKIVLQQQDSIKISHERDNKKNQNVESICIHYHSITSKWILLVLIRTSMFKSQYKSNMHSVLKGYQIKLTQNRNHQFSYKFQPRNQLFSLKLNQQMISLASQPSCGLHLISNDGTYVFLKQQFRYLQEQSIFFQQGFVQDFKQSKFSLCYVIVHSQSNKSIFGTFNGKMIIYDLFSKNFKVIKLSNNQIIQIKSKDNIIYVLTSDQKMHLYDIDRKQQIQLLNVRNQEKLHQKVHYFDVLNQGLYFYGTQVKKYIQYQDQQLIHETRKVNKLYNWRLSKLQQNKKNLKKDIPKSKISYQYKSNSQLVIQSKSYFVILSQILQAVLISKQTMKVKFTMILPIPFDSKVTKMALSKDQKLLCLLLFDQNIYIFNIYTQELFSYIKPSIKHKYTTIQFLDDKNQYLLAAGTESGSIILIPYPSLPQRQFKTLNYHKKQVTLTNVIDNVMITSAEDRSIAIWVLPFNVLKYQIKANVPNYMIDNIGIQGLNTFLRSLNGSICELNFKDGKIKSMINQTSNWTVCAFDYCTDQLFGIQQGISSSQLVILKKDKTKQCWQIRLKLKLPSKSKVVYIGIIPTQKAIIFYQAGQYIIFNYPNNSLSKAAMFNN